MFSSLIPWKRRRKQENRYPSPLEKRRTPFAPDDFLTVLPFSDPRGWQPKVDIKEGKKHITIKAEMPGVDKNDIDISLENRVLRITGEEREEKEEAEENFYRRESSWGRFLRRIELPAEVDENDIAATYKRGILTIRLKKTKAAQGRRIQVKSK